ncbi:MAG TPA: ABC transporter permease [Vicinamibacterales bacterium]|nr:ABC transporter permease [Vicinamibacterales bacterium]
MTRWRKVPAILAFEFLSTIKRPGYLITTFGMPLFMGLYAAIVAVPAYYAEQHSAAESSVFGIVDHADVLHLTSDARPSPSRIPDDLRRALEAAGQTRAIEQLTSDATIVFRPFADEASARRALVARGIKGYYVLPPDYLRDGVVRGYTSESAGLSESDARDELRSFLRERLLGGRVDGALAARVLDPVAETQSFAVTRAGDVRDGGSVASIVRLVVPLAFMVLFLMSILMTSGYLMQGTAAEKENKVVEVLLSSARPDEILAGKLIGLGAAGLLQIVVWLAIVLAAGVGIAPLLLAARVEVPWGAVALALPFFLTAFLFFGSLMLGTGSLGSNMREAQQLAMIWSLTAALPMIMMAVLINEPHGLTARIMTWVPFTSGAVVMFREAIDPMSLAWWEVAGALFILIISTFVALRLGARLFRIGLLNAGARPSLREIIRQARLA